MKVCRRLVERIDEVLEECECPSKSWKRKRRRKKSQQSISTQTNYPFKPFTHSHGELSAGSLLTHKHHTKTGIGRENKHWNKEGKRKTVRLTKFTSCLWELVNPLSKEDWNKANTSGQTLRTPHHTKSTGIGKGKGKTHPLKHKNIMQT
jgi:hypothetical protein